MNMEMLLGTIRTMLAFGAGMMASKGYIKGEHVDLFVNSLIGLGVVGWSVANKVESQKKLEQAEASGPAIPPQSGVPLLIGAAFLTGFLFLAPSALADSPPRQSKIWTPQELPASVVPPVSSTLYMSVIGSYAALQDEFSDGQFRAGLGIGYLAKFSSLGVGVDFDATRQLSDDERRFQDEFDNWNLSARARVGWFVTPTLMPFASVGWARIFTEDTMTYGLGIESFATERVSLRFEATKYEISDDLLDLKLSVNFKF